MQDTNNYSIPVSSSLTTFIMKSGRILNFLDQKSILVTGATGFLAKSKVHHLVSYTYACFCLRLLKYNAVLCIVYSSNMTISVSRCIYILTWICINIYSFCGEDTKSSTTC